MPSFGDIMEAVDLFKVDAVAVDDDRCVAVRNRNSKCRKCVDACISGAITVQRNKVAIDSSACVNCGCCASVCPMGALSMVEPTSEGVMRSVLATADRRSGMAVIACSRAVANGQADPDKYAEVACLGRMNEAELMSLASVGLSDIVLVDGCCSTCKYGAASSCVDEAVDATATFLDACAADAIVTRASQFPPECLIEEGDSLRGKSRRGLACQTGGYMRHVAQNVAKKAVDEQLGAKDDAAARRRRRIASNGKLPVVEPFGNHAIIDAMQALAAKGGNASAQPEGRVATRRFGSLSIDANECSGCGMCVLFCPTEALRYDDYANPDDPDMRYVEFRACDCTQCMLCHDICLRRCLEVSGEVALRDVCSLEPVVLEIPRPSMKKPFTA